MFIDNSGNRIEEYTIYEMKQTRVVFLLTYLIDKVTNGDIDKAMSVLYKSKTFEYLQNTETQFWWKSEEELKYLLKKELLGDVVAWKKQAF